MNTQKKKRDSNLTRKKTNLLHKLVLKIQSFDSKQIALQRERENKNKDFHITSAMLNRNAGLPLLGGRPIVCSLVSREQKKENTEGDCRKIV